MTQVSSARGRVARRPGMLRAALRVRRTRVGLALTVVIVLVALVGPALAPHSPSEFVGIPNTPPGPAAPGALFGTDNLGRDVLTRFLHGGRILLFMAAVVTVLGVGLGSLVGVVAAYHRGWRDEVLMRTGDVLLAFPQLIIALLFLSIIGPKLWLLALVVGGSKVPLVARVIRGAALAVVERDYVKAAEALGEPRWKVMLREILPNVTGPIVVEVGLRMAYSIGLLAALSFLGLGVQPPAADWGLMINENRVVLTVQPWPVMLPVVAIAVLTVGISLVADGIGRVSSGIDRAAP